MQGFFYKALLVATAAFVLTACDNNGGGGDNGGNDDDQARNPQDNFGAGFAAAFNADANSEPVDPKRDDIIAVNATGDPVDF